MDLGQTDAEQAVKRGPDIEGGRVDLFGLDAWLVSFPTGFSPLLFSAAIRTCR
jgi:hypothetical protein